MDLKILLIPQRNKYLGSRTITLKENVPQLLGRNGGKADITYNTKVVSRKHATLLFKDQKLYLRDSGSSSGTFLNNTRLSQPGKESEFFEIKDGETIQLGEAYQNEEEIHPSVICKVYWAKSFNGDLLGPEIADQIETEYTEICKAFDEMSNILSVFEIRQKKLVGSICTIETQDIVDLEVKYSLDTLISDTDIALFKIIDSFLQEHKELRSSIAKLLTDKVSIDKESPTRKFRAPSIIVADKSPQIFQSTNRLVKRNSVMTIVPGSNLKLGSEFL